MCAFSVFLMSFLRTGAYADASSQSSKVCNCKHFLTMNIGPICCLIHCNAQTTACHQDRAPATSWLYKIALFMKRSFSFKIWANKRSRCRRSISIGMGAEESQARCCVVTWLTIPSACLEYMTWLVRNQAPCHVENSPSVMSHQHPAWRVNTGHAMVLSSVCLWTLSIRSSLKIFLSGTTRAKVCPARTFNSCMTVPWRLSKPPKCL